ncbi:hypothetical protein DRQ16_04215, partial [bacterium]
LIDTFVPDGNDTVMLGYGALEGEICKIAQTFRPSDTIISGIGLRLMRNYPAYYSPITVMIEETDASGAPSGVRIARIDGRSAYFSIHWYRCSPDSFVDWDGYFPCRVDPNKTYAIVIRYVKSSIEGDTFSYYLKKAVDVYPAGNLWVYDADNDIWLPCNGDLVFWVYYPRELTVHDRWVQFKCNQVAKVVGIYRQVLRDSIGMLPFMDFFTPVDGGDIVLGDSITAIAQSFYPSHEYFRGMEFFIRRAGNPGDILAVVKRMAVDPLNGNPVPEGEIIKVITIPFYKIPETEYGWVFADFDSCSMERMDTVNGVYFRYAVVISCKGDSENYYLVRKSGGENYNLGSGFVKKRNEWTDIHEDMAFRVYFMDYPKVYAYSSYQDRILGNQTTQERFGVDWDTLASVIDVADPEFTRYMSPRATLDALGNTPVMGHFTGDFYAYDALHVSSYDVRDTVFRVCKEILDSLGNFGLSYFQEFCDPNSPGSHHPCDALEDSFLAGFRDFADFIIEREDSFFSPVFYDTIIRVEFITPSEGAYAEMGGPCLIQWKVIGNGVAEQKLFYSLDGVNWDYIDSPVDTFYVWDAPLISGDVYFKIEVTGNNGLTGEDVIHIKVGHFTDKRERRKGKMWIEGDTIYYVYACGDSVYLVYHDGQEHRRTGIDEGHSPSLAFHGNIPVIVFCRDSCLYVSYRLFPGNLLVNPGNYWSIRNPLVLVKHDTLCVLYVEDEYLLISAVSVPFHSRRNIVYKEFVMPSFTCVCTDTVVKGYQFDLQDAPSF